MRVMPRSLLYTALLAAALSPQCTCPGPPFPPPPDAGPLDGSAHDANSHDAGPRDGGPHDAGPQDAGHDAGPWTDGVWMGLPGVPRDCEAAVAIDPMAIVPRLSFEACPDRPTGCRQLVVDWEPRYSSAPELNGWLLGVPSAYSDGSSILFELSRPDPEAPGTRVEHIFSDDGGHVLAVFRAQGAIASNICSLFGLAIGEGRFVSSYMGASATNPPFWFVGGELSAPAESARLMATVQLGALPQELVVGAEQAVFEVAGADTLYRIGWDGSVRRIDNADGTPAMGYPGSVVGHDFIFDGYGVRSQIRIATDGAPPRVLIDPTDPDSEATVHRRTDGRTIGWFQGWRRVGGSPYTYERVDIYGADYATNAVDIHPVLLGTKVNADVHRSIVAGFGHVAIIDDDASVIRFFRVADQRETEHPRTARYDLDRVRPRHRPARAVGGGWRPRSSHSQQRRPAHRLHRPRATAVTRRLARSAERIRVASPACLREPAKRACCPPMSPPRPRPRPPLRLPRACRRVDERARGRR